MNPNLDIRGLLNFNSIKVRLKLRFEVSILTSSIEFQFHKGTIKTVRRNYIRKSLTRFQFHKGTIKTRIFAMYSFPCLWFQFHKGTIKTIPPVCSIVSLTHFNSIKVRLKLLSSQRISSFDKYFNSIKVRLKLQTLSRWCAVVLFQFHKGTIKTGGVWYVLVCSWNFNSIKVRLKLYSTAYHCLRKRFQFHKGTIKTLCAVCDLSIQ